jgi:hypothetical protein
VGHSDSVGQSDLEALTSRRQKGSALEWRRQMGLAARAERRQRAQAWAPPAEAQLPVDARLLLEDFGAAYAHSFSRHSLTR